MLGKRWVETEGEDNAEEGRNVGKENNMNERWTRREKNLKKSTWEGEQGYGIGKR